MEQIILSLENNIGTITFNNDDKRNALTFQLLEEFIAALEELEKKEARVVVIRSKPGSKVWSAGLYINELPDPGTDPLPYHHPLERTMRAIGNFPAPVIAMAEGSIWGGACDLATVCDIVIGTKNTTFAITPARLGVAYNSNGILHVIRVFGLHTAKEMFFTAKPISAEQAYNVGALNHIVDVEELEEFTYKTAKSISFNSPLSVSVAKKQINIMAKSNPVIPSDYEMIDELRIKAYRSYDYVEGLKAFKEKRHPNFIGK